MWLPHVGQDNYALVSFSVPVSMNVMAIRFAPSGDFLAIIASIGHSRNWVPAALSIWSFLGGDLLRTLPQDSNDTFDKLQAWYTYQDHASLSFSVDKPLLASAWSSHVSIWNYESDEIVGEIHGSAPERVALDSRGRRLAISYFGDEGVKLFDVSTIRGNVDLEEHPFVELDTGDNVIGRQVSQIVFSPSGDILAVLLEDREVELWDAGLGCCLHSGTYRRFRTETWPNFRT